MKLEQSFGVQAPVDAVWSALLDVQRVAPCLPGAEISEVGEDGSYRGTFQVKLGPTTAAYRGEVHLEDVDEAARLVVMKASGQDKRGQGAARATITNRLIEDGGGTRVDVVADFTITGRLARFGRGGMIEDVSARLLSDFSECLATTIGSAPDAASAEAPGAGAPGAGAKSVAAPGAAAPGAAPPGSEPPGPSSATPPAKPVRGLSLMVSVLWGRFKRLFRRR
jgi:uncharacterized protein